MLMIARLRLTLGSTGIIGLRKFQGSMKTNAPSKKSHWQVRYFAKLTGTAKSTMTKSAYVLLRTGLSLCLVLVFMLHASGQQPVPLLTQLELYAYDARLRLGLPGDIDSRIVIVDIDEQSLLSEGQWPWPRQRVAQLVERLFSNYQVRLLGFDLVFSDYFLVG